MINYLQSIIKRFHHQQRGAALTEFILFLPIWITVFVGVINLGKLGVETTKVQMIAQSKMWSMAVETTTSGVGSKWGLPFSGGTDAVGVAGELGRGIGDGYEVIVSGSQLATGHWGESYMQTLPITLVTNSVDDLTLKPKDIVDDYEYPNSIVNDSPGSSLVGLSGSSGIKGILTKLVSGSGATVSFAAGIRYGMAYGRHTEAVTLLRGTSANPDYHYDVMAAPSPVENRFQPFAVARLMAELDGSDNYSVMMNFGESEWESDNSGGGGQNSIGIGTNWNDKIEKNKKDNEKNEKEGKDKEEKCKKIPKPEGCPP